MHNVLLLCVHVVHLSAWFVFVLSHDWLFRHTGAPESVPQVWRVQVVGEGAGTVQVPSELQVSVAVHVSLNVSVGLQTQMTPFEPFEPQAP
jgi:hypothetical protein